MSTVMSTDEQFVDDLERAARNLRGAAAGALISGLTPQEIARIVAAGIGDMQHMSAVGRSRARVQAIGYVPTQGESLPPPEWTMIDDGHGQPGDADFRAPSIHPCVPRAA